MAPIWEDVEAQRIDHLTVTLVDLILQVIPTQTIRHLALALCDGDEVTADKLLRNLDLVIQEAHQSPRHTAHRLWRYDVYIPNMRHHIKQFFHG